MSCGAGFANRILQKVELELLAAKKRRLENEMKCWRLAKECLEAIKRINEKMKEMNLPETARWNGDLLALKPSRSVSPSVELREKVSSRD